MKVLIHACKRRIKYVDEFLVPALIKSGYERGDIFVYLDSDGDGCLKSYIKSFDILTDTDEDIWHLQDDVLPRRDFYTHAEMALKYFLPGGIICGYGNKEFYKIEDFGYAYNSKEKFYSFPCIRINNKMAIKFNTWLKEKADKREDLQKYIVNNKFVDYLFKIFVEEEAVGEKEGIFNYRPCLVDHVDEYCGGSTVNKNRPKPSKALIFGDVEAWKNVVNWFKGQNTYERK